MPEITLSRLQHTIKDWNDQFYSSTNQFNSMDLSYVYRIFSMTSQEDYNCFLEKINKRKKSELALLDKLKNMLNYIGYLKDVLNEANQKLGISQKLVRADLLNREISCLDDFISHVQGEHFSGLVQIEDVDFYKSAFTEQLKYYDQRVYLFSTDDLEALKDRKRNLIAERQQLNDMIATLNQTHTVSIKSIDEFCQE